MKDQALWSTAETAAYLGVPIKTLYQWSSRASGPPSFKIGRHRKYAPQEVDIWLQARRSSDGGGVR